ncbi:hypothetical protein TrLO_g14575 [Triparma laevis f. longispina]|uniref:Uncharacterized protein n=1 Tax=Triparma laevis f. longispina TaxID=1714387 RepID=A0A9W7C739_9STRA|nr:hypothetical protein TrLO_g14575 [Triparma laevis f. longispina]
MAPTQNLDGTYTQADQLVGQSLLLLHKPLRLGSRVTSPEFSPLVGTVVHSPKGWVTVDFDPPNKEVLLKEDVIQCHGISLRLKPPTSQYVEKVVDLPVNGQGLTGFKVALVMRRPNNFVIEGVGGSWRSKVIGAECGRVGSVRSRIGSDGKSSPTTYHKNCTFNTCSSDERTSPNPETYRVMRINVGGSTEISG